MGAIFLAIQLKCSHRSISSEMNELKISVYKMASQLLFLRELQKLKSIMEVDRAADSNLKGFSNFIRTDKVK